MEGIFVIFFALPLVVDGTLPPLRESGSFLQGKFFKSLDKIMFSGDNSDSCAITMKQPKA